MAHGRGLSGPGPATEWPANLKAAHRSTAMGRAGRAPRPAARGEAPSFGDQSSSRAQAPVAASRWARARLGAAGPGRRLMPLALRLPLSHRGTLVRVVSD